jgi:hypothetical protein
MNNTNEQNIIDLIDLCDEYFINYWENSNKTNKTLKCVFCGCLLGKKNHTSACPITKYRKIKKDILYKEGKHEHKHT